MEEKLIIKKLREDRRNEIYTNRGINPIFQLNPKSKILIIGQAPGEKVEETGILFNDKSGENLVKWLGISEDVLHSEDFSIIPMDFYYPGKGKQATRLLDLLLQKNTIHYY